MEEQKFILKCIKEVGSGKAISFKEGKRYEIFSIEPGMPGE